MRTIGAILLAVAATALVAGQSCAITATAVEDANTRFSNPDTNYGTANDLRVEPSTGILRYGWWKFSTAGAKSQLDALYGAGQWSVGGVTFNASSFYRQYTSYAGDMSAGYNADDSWTETGITWTNQPGNTVMLDTISIGVPDPGLHVIVTWDFGTYSALVNDIMSGDDVSVCVQSVEPTGGGGADFDAREWSGGQYTAYLNITVVPEPGCAVSLMIGVAATAALGFRRRRW